MSSKKSKTSDKSSKSKISKTTAGTKKIVRKDSKISNKKSIVDDIVESETQYQAWDRLNEKIHSSAVWTDPTDVEPYRTEITQPEFACCNVFSTKSRVPLVLTNLLGLEKGAKLTRHQLVDHLYEYFQEHELINKKNHNIVPNKPLSKVFGLHKNEHMTFYDLQPRINKLFSETN